jgi:hypothetical protein
MSLPDDFAADLVEIEGDLEASLTWSGTAYRCTLGGLSVRSDISGLIGVREGVDQVAVVRTQLFVSDRPAMRDTVIIGGSTYRIMRMETDPQDVAVTLYLNEEDA